MKLVYTHSAASEVEDLMAKVIAITSGKGGVGKTNAATNLALSLSALGKKVCVFDADASLANINILFGIQPEYTLEHLLNGEKSLQQIIVDGPRGIKVVPAASGIAECANLDQRQRDVLLNSLDELQKKFDYLIIDTAAGVSDQVTDFVQAAQYAMIIITPEPTSLTDAFSLVKLLKRKGHDRPIHVMVNMAMDFENSQAVFRRFDSAVKKYISADVRYLGYCKVDETIISSVSLQCPAVLLKPESPASQCFYALAEGIENQLTDDSKHSFSDYWRAHSENTTTEAPESMESGSVPMASPAEPLNFAEALEHLSDTLLGDAPPDEDHQALFEAFITRYQNRYAKNPEPNVVELNPSASELAAPKLVTNYDLPDVVSDDPIAALYNHLDANNFPASEIKELVTTLETLYTHHHGQGLRTFESMLAQLLSMAHNSDSRLRSLHQQIRQSYERQFHKPFYDLEAEFIESLHNPEYTQPEFNQLLDDLRKTYQQRFDMAYKTPADARVQELEELSEDLENQKHELKNQVLAATQQLDEKSQLIDQIQRLLQAP